MKLKFKETITKEVEIALPHFMKSNCHFYKVYSEEKCIQVTDLDGNYQIQQAHSGLAFLDGQVEATAEEFKDAFERVSVYLTTIKKQ